MRSHCFGLIWLACGWQTYKAVSGDKIWGQEKTSWGIVILATVLGDPCLFTGTTNLSGIWYLAGGNVRLIYYSMGGGTSVCDWPLVGVVQMLRCSQLFQCQQAAERRWPWWTLFNSPLVIGSLWASGFSSCYKHVYTVIFLSSVTLMETRSCRFFIFISALISFSLRCVISNGSAASSSSIHWCVREWLHTLCHPTRHNECSSGALPLCPAPGSVWLYLKWCIPSYWSSSWWSHRQAYPALPSLSAFWMDTQRALCACARLRSSV